MAPSNVTKPKRKRQRKRKEVESSDSSSSSSSSDSEEEVEEVKSVVVSKLPEASSSSSEASSSSEDESSEDERTKRRGRIPNKNSLNNTNGNSTTTASASNPIRRPYPSRSPSPQIFNPANLPLGQSPFPLLKSLEDGKILNGSVIGDVGFGNEVVLNEEDKLAEDKLQESKFGEWWRARLVQEFETDLGGLASEPGLTAPRLSLLLDSLTALSTLHTTSSSLAKKSNSIWIHDPSSSVDPLSNLELAEGGGEDWGKATVGGLSDLEIGEEGVRVDLGKSNVVNGGEEMQVD